VGAAPDADLYGDRGSDTFGHVIDATGVALPNLERLGLLRAGGRSDARPGGAWGKMREVSAGKDSTSGHWEMMGLATARPFPVYPGGFPSEIVDPIEREAGVRFLGNRAASGTAILDELGAEHLATGRPILYTSADSVFQVAAHEDVVPPGRLWEICAIARRHLAGRHAVGRVIARPFTGRPGALRRTERRRDFSLAPPGETLLDRAVAAGRRTYGIGKISDLFAGRGISGSSYSSSDADGIVRTLGRMREADDDLIFTNLVDFDSKYGHRNDAAGFAENLARLDRAIPGLRGALEDGDLLFVTADHGCDPCDVSTDHTREWVPLLAAGKRVREGAELGARATFADLAATVGEWLGLSAGDAGTSMLPALLA
jgi:phosphopentomutase